MSSADKGKKDTVCHFKSQCNFVSFIFAITVRSCDCVGIGSSVDCGEIVL